jgi:hypothetical protein
MCYLTPILFKGRIDFFVFDTNEVKLQMVPMRLNTI